MAPGVDSEGEVRPSAHQMRARGVFLDVATCEIWYWLCLEASPCPPALLVNVQTSHVLGVGV